MSNLKPNQTVRCIAISNGYFRPPTLHDNYIVVEKPYKAFGIYIVPLRHVETGHVDRYFTQDFQLVSLNTNNIKA